MYSGSKKKSQDAMLRAENKEQDFFKLAIVLVPQAARFAGVVPSLRLVLSE